MQRMKTQTHPRHKRLKNKQQKCVVRLDRLTGNGYYGIPTQALLGEMSCYDNIPPKREIDELESLGACRRS